MCALYVRERKIGFMVIFGKSEREKFEEDRVIPQRFKVFMMLQKHIMTESG